MALDAGIEASACARNSITSTSTSDLLTYRAIICGHAHCWQNRTWMLCVSRWRI